MRLTVENTFLMDDDQWQNITGLNEADRELNQSTREHFAGRKTSVLKVCSARQLCLTAEGHKRSQQ